MPLPTAVSHLATLEDFSASVRLDRHSNSYLNLTLIGARGTLHGHVQPISIEQNHKRENIGFELVVPAHSETSHSTTTAQVDGRAFSYSLLINSSWSEGKVLQTFIRMPALIRRTQRICLWTPGWYHS